MLSRNAERVYWLGRYIERTEDTARMLKAFTQVMLDIPKNKKISWDMLLKILSSDHSFFKLYDEVSEHNVICFLLADERNPSSIRSSVKAARENARTSRDIIPLEGWEMLNDLNLLVKQSSDKATHRRYRYQFLSEVIARSQQFNGMIASSLSRNQAYDFFQMGGFLERADMTTRILDVAAGILLRRHIDVSAHDSLIWLEILKSQNAVLMYRSANGPAINPKSILYFILCRNDFPRSIKYCLEEMKSFATTLPDNSNFFVSWEDLNNKLNENLNLFDKSTEINPEQLHIFFDDIQKRLINLHNNIADTWFPSNVELPPLKKIKASTETQKQKKDVTVQVQSQSQSQNQGSKS